MTPQDVARDLLERLSIMPLPVPYKSKNPNRPGWEQERVTLEEIPRRFSGKRLNVGGMWGEPSDGVVDIDQDCPQARTAADVLLPTTGAVYGHEGNPHSHALYRCLDGTAPARTRRWKDIDGTTLIELRSTGAHSLMPGSVHPDGYPYVWEAAGEPAEVDGEELGRLVARGAAASILARHWPAEGGRHDAAGALAGGLARLGWPDADVLRFVEAVVRARCDDDPDDRLRFAAETLKNGRAGRATTGWKSLAQAVPGDVLARVLEWLGAPVSPQEPAPSPADPRPTGSGSDQEDDTAAGEQTTPEPEPAPTVVTMADVETRPLLWAWRNYLPLGATTLIEGDPDEGKSLILMDLVARITTGRVLPDGSRGDVDGPRDVLLVCAEDALDTTVRPRLLAAGADLARVHVLSEVPEPIRRFKKGEELIVGWRWRPPEWPGDAALVHKEADRVNAVLLGVDPLTAHLGPKVDPNSDRSIRHALAASGAWARKGGRVFFVVRHFNKSSSETNPKYRGAGSIGLLGLARSALLVAPDPDDAVEAGGAGERRVLAIQKHNLAAAGAAPSLSYRIGATPEHVPYIEWLGESAHTSRTLLRPTDPEDTSALGEAKRFLEQYLTQARPADDVAREAKRLSISAATLRRARIALGVVPVPVRTDDGDAIKYWEWPAVTPREAPREAPARPPTHLEHLAPNGGCYQEENLDAQGLEHLGLGAQGDEQVGNGALNGPLPDKADVPRAAVTGLNVGAQGDEQVGLDAQGLEHLGSLSGSAPRRGLDAQVRGEATENVASVPVGRQRLTVDREAFQAGLDAGLPREEALRRATVGSAVHWPGEPQEEGETGAQEDEARLAGPFADRAPHDPARSAYAAGQRAGFPFLQLRSGRTFGGGEGAWWRDVGRAEGERDQDALYRVVRHFELGDEEGPR